VRADVAVNYLERPACAVLQLVRVMQSRARVRQHLQDDARRDLDAALLASAIELRERVTLDVLHGEIEDVVLLTKVEDLGDVQVLDAGRDACLVEEHLLEAQIRRELRQDRLDRYELLEPVLAALARHPNAGHSALGDRAEQLVAIELVARREWRGDGYDARHCFVASLARLHAGVQCAAQSSHALGRCGGMR
jgi:hypothetical protein